VTFDADESSVRDSRPVELYDFHFQARNVHYYRTSYHRDFTYLGNTYSAVTIKRGSLQVVDSQNVPEMTVDLPPSDPLVQAYIGVGVPPQNTKVTITRYQIRSASVEQLWTGLVSGVTIKGRDASFRIAAITDDPFRIPIPNVRLSKLCQHVLYDPRCTISRAANSVATVASIAADFRTLTVSSLGSFSGDPTAFQFGDLVHGPSGERRTIIAQASLVITVDIRLPTTALSGDAVTISRGCAHDPGACTNKFSNMQNYGGHPNLISTNFIYSNIAKARGN
jgi:hypothetical protein